MIQKITGTITLADGSTSDFQITAGEGAWSQWGATRERLGETSEPLTAMSDALTEYMGDDED